MTIINWLFCLKQKFMHKLLYVTNAHCLHEAQKPVRSSTSNWNIEAILLYGFLFYTLYEGCSENIETLTLIPLR